MAELKYSKNILREPFFQASPEFGGGTIFKHTNDDNMGVVYEHICIDDSRWALHGTHVSETHELFCFIGANPENIRDLGAEISFRLGLNQEEFLINDTTVMTVPAGLKYGPVTVKKFSKPFILLRIINMKERQQKLDEEAKLENDFALKAMLEGSEVAKRGKKFWMNNVRGPFYIDYEPGWTGTSIWAHHDEYKAGISLGYHCIVTPYDVRMNHGHDFHETLAFLSGDPKNIRELGAEVAVRLGDEQEVHTFNTPTIISMPPGLKHCPMLVDKITKPVVFLEVSATKLFKGKPEDR